MKRSEMISELNKPEMWDIIIIGGGATGLGTAVESASRGYKTLLLEQSDFAKGTSSRSTKLVHGGVRYLQQGDVKLVLEALHERGLLTLNAPHLVRHQSFIVPNYSWWEGPFYGVGMKVYDALAGKLGIGASRHLSREETLKNIPTLEPKDLRGGVMYYDGQFDDARLATNLAQTVVDHNGTVLNYFKVVGLLKANGMLSGVEAVDLETDTKYNISARVVVNATGVFVDDILRMDNPEAASIITPSQGVHIVLGKEFLPGDSAIMVPHTDDGRVLFAVPWHDCVVVGTTDTPVKEPSLEPRALEEEIDFILTHAARYMTKDPKRSDVLSIYAGLRPLVKSGDSKNTAALSRDHSLFVSPTGLVTITGGKWTTYRRMGEDTINSAAVVAGLDNRPSVSSTLRIHGWLKNIDDRNHLHFYGTDALAIKNLIKENPDLGKPIHERLFYNRAEVVWAVREEMARTVEDVLARRTRSLLLNARASIECAPEVARLMAAEMGYGDEWIRTQVEEYSRLANRYILN